MNFTAYLESKRELQRAMTKLRADLGHGLVTEDAWRTRMCALIKQSYEMDLAYAETLGLTTKPRETP